MTALSRTIKLGAVGIAAGAMLAATPGGAAAAGAPTTTTTERTHVDFGTFVEDSPPCTSEPVEWTGGYDTVLTTVSGPTTFVRSLNYSQQLTGVGLTSGSSYVLNAHYHDIVRTGTQGVTVFVEPLIYAQVSKDGRPNYVVREIITLVIDPSGNVVVNSDVNSGGCVG
ncbi:MAG: hypothetical protein ACJ74O_19700 [Frankiaceae bacterium]